MTKQELINTKNILFNEDFSIKTDNIEDLKEFCRFLTDVTGVQICTAFGYVNELLPRVYTSVLNIME